MRLRDVTILTGLLSCAFLVGVSAGKRFWVPGLFKFRTLSSQSLNAVRAGQALSLADVDWGASRLSLVIGLRKDCPYCTKSLPFYKKLMEMRAKVRLIVLSPENKEEMITYLASNGVEVDQLIQQPFEQVGIVATPTLLLLNEKGVVMRAWVGQLSSQRERELREVIQSQ